MVITGIVLLIIAMLGFARALLVPLGLMLVILGGLWDILHFLAHGVALIF